MKKARKLGRAHDLPEDLPQGEHVLWQGAPGIWPLARAMHIRIAALYFAALLGWYLFDRAIRDPQGMMIGFAHVCLLAAAALGLHMLYALLVARTTSYTLTTTRLVLRVGIAMPISFNIPFTRIAAAALNERKDGSGDILVTLLPGERMSFIGLWPHAKSGKQAQVQPFLRAIPNVAAPARLLARLLAESADQPQAILPAADAATSETPSRAPIAAAA